MRAFLLAATLVTSLLAVAQAAEPVELAYQITLPDPAALALHVTVAARGVAADAVWEPGMRQAGAYMRNFRRGPQGVSYVVDLGKMARAEKDPDLAAPIVGGALFNDGAVLWRPAGLVDGARITIHFSLPTSHPLAAPWEVLPAGGFAVNTMQLDGGAYVVLGPHQVLPVKLAGNVLSAVVVGGGYQASAAGLTSWVERSAAMVAAFGGGKLPVPRTQVILFPSGGEKAGQFGTTMRWGLGSIVLFFGSQAPDAAFASDWVAPHELFHLTNPHLQTRIPWFTEGFTTYYQDVIRARAGARPPAVMWADLLANVEDACGSTHLQTLRSVSGQLRVTHQYLRVYWGGACTALVLDVALREVSRNARSLDDLFRELRARSLGPDGPLDEGQVIAAFHAALPPSHWAHGWLDGALDGRRALPLRALLERLGLTQHGEDVVITRDAPWAAITAAIMGQPAGNAAWPVRPPLPSVR